MNRIALLVLLAAAWGLVAAPLSAGEGRSVEVLYIPRGDLGRAPGYSAEGAFLPLDEILELVAAANQRESSPQANTAVTCNELALEGELDQHLDLRGKIAFSSPWKGWAATRVDDGRIPWSAQSQEGSPAAFLVGIDGATYLIVEGPGDGTLSVEAWLAFDFAAAQPVLNLGRWHVPARVLLTHSEHWRAIETSAPSREEGGRLVISPAQGKDLLLQPRVRPPLRSPAAVLQRAERTIRVVASGLEVIDRIRLESQFEEDGEVKFRIPEGLELLELTISPEATFRRSIEDEYVVRITEPTPQLRITVRSSTSMDGRRSLVPPLILPGTDVTSSLQLVGSNDWVPILSAIPPSLFLGDGEAGSRNYECWGALPSVAVELIPKSLPPLPTVFGVVAIDRNEAHAIFEIDGIPAEATEFLFRVHPDWKVSEIVGASATAGQTGSVFGHRREDGLWSIRWASTRQPELLRVLLHNAGSWGAPGRSSKLALPHLWIEDVRPATYELAVSAPDTLELQASDLASLVVLPVSELSRAWEQPIADEVDAKTLETTSESIGTRASLALRASGSNPKGLLEIRGRSSDVRASVVTALSIRENRTTCRTRITYNVRYAPEDRFHVLLPRDVGPAVRIDGQGIRETLRESTGEGELFTLITQHGVLGDFPVTFEWTRDRSTAQGAIDAPQIGVPDVTSQQGFILLEATEALRLNATASNLAETDLAEVPENPWQGESRILAAYRYVEPPYSLRIETEKFEPEPKLAGLIRSATLRTTVSEHGEHLTLAEYHLLPMAEQQFLEVELPGKTQVWSVLVNGQGERPARRARADGRGVLLVPLPTQRTSTGDVAISVLYRQPGDPLAGQSRFELDAPRLALPVNKTTWQLNLPSGFEYLSFQGTFIDLINVREPFISFVRRAYYPSRLVFLQTPLPALIAAMVFLLLAIPAVAFTVRRVVKAWRRAQPGEARKRAFGCGGRLLELLVIGLIVVILASISVPNFLEAQVRSKASRVMSDARSMATAIESYYVDNNRYPDKAELLWQGPVKYLVSPFIDPYNVKDGEPLKYIAGQEAVRSAVAANLVPPNQPPEPFWLVYSVGPDTRDDRAQLKYDPTNGTNSPGDIIRLAESAWDPAFKKTRARETSRDLPTVTMTDKHVSDEVFEYDPTEGTISAGDVWRVKNGDSKGKDQAIEAAGRGPKSPSAVGAASTSSTPVDADDFSGTIKRDVLGAEEVARQAGLLSLAIEVPEGGYQRQFEGLTGDTSLQVRLLNQQLFQRLRFSVWVLVALILSAVWIFARRFYVHAFILFLAVAFFGPLIAPTPWVAFYNAALQGALFSLLAPLMGRAIGSLSPPSKGPAAALGLVLLALAPTQLAPAEEPVRVIAPYDELLPDPDGNPSVFVDRALFESLWNDAHHATPAVADGLSGAFLSSWSFNGQWHPERSTVAGNLKLSAVNTSDRPSTTPIGLERMTLSELTSSPAGATLQMDGGGVLLLLPAHWRGTLEARFDAPCESQGTTGRFQFTAPKAGSSSWQIAVPFSEISAESDLPIQIETGEGGTILRGTAGAGPHVVTWGARGAGAALDVEAAEWRSNLETEVVWEHLAHAMVSQTLHLNVLSDTGALPSEVTLRIGPLRIMGVQGPQVQSATVERDTLRIRLRKSREASIDVVALMPGTTDTWRLDALGIEAAGPSRQTVRLVFGESLEVLSVDASGLERQPTRGLRPGFSTQQYQVANADWSVVIGLRPLPVVFDVSETEVFAIEEGLLRRAGRITVRPRGSALRHFTLDLPPETVLQEVSGIGLTDWVWSNGQAHLYFSPPAEQPFTIDYLAHMPLEGMTRALTLQPVQIATAGELSQSVAMVLSPDLELTEVDLHGAVSAPPSKEQLELAERLMGDSPSAEQVRGVRNSSLRSYTIEGPRPLLFHLTPIASSALVTVFNRVTISNGAKSLFAIVEAEPRRGRMRQVEFLLALPEASASAVGRLQVQGPIRGFRTEDDATGFIRVLVELDAPYSRSVPLQVQLDQSAPTEAGDTIEPTLLLPTEEAGSRAILLLRRDYEGELNVAHRAGARLVEPTAIAWPDSFRVLPSDQVYELSRALPSFQVVRHAQGETLRAVVEVLRQRTVLTQDGLERHELELVLQNQSEQFLRIELPSPRADVSIFEVRVAGKTVNPTFASEQGREVLLVPLIRTGILDPELTVRVAYTAQGAALDGRGRRQQKLPEILGGIPVMQSALILMMPTSYQFKDFEGSLNQVELIDLEVDEALRQARRAENLSEIALRSSGQTLTRALSSLKNVQAKATSQYSYAMSTTEAYDRREVGQRGWQEGAEDALKRERALNLQQANEAQSQLHSNVQQLIDAEADTEVQQLAGAIQRQAIQPVATQPRSESAQVDFPREGQVFVFRQIQGTGAVAFKYASRQTAGMRYDILLAAGLMVLLIAGLVLGKKLFSNRLRVGMILITAGLLAFLAGVAVDLALLSIGVGLVLVTTGWLVRRRHEALEAE